MMKSLVLSCLVLCLGQIHCVLNPKVVCYYEDWFYWHTGEGKMTVDDVDSSLCTHVVYAYLGSSAAGEVTLPDPYLMVDKEDLAKFSANKGKAQALAAIGGFSQSSGFAGLVSSASSRSAFVRSVVDFLKEYDFDGVSIDWSNPAWTTYQFEDYVKLLDEMYSEFNGRYTLGITVSSRPQNFKADQVNKHVDFISVQTYDYAGSWENTVGHEAPLDAQLKTLNEWEKAGAQADKLLMTIPLFAHTWILSDPAKTTPGSKAKGPGKQGPWSQADGKLSYNELCSQMQADPSVWEVHNDPKLATIYAINKETHTWVTFESSITAQTKTDKATSLGYGGVVAQALENDDYHGLCGTKYPILKGINAGLNKDPVTRPPVTVTTPKTVTPDPTKVCQKTGTVRDPKDCNVYHKCTEFMPGVMTDDIEHCAKGEAFDDKDMKCKDRSEVPGC